MIIPVHACHVRGYDSDIEIHSPCGIIMTEGVSHQSGTLSLVVDKGIASLIRKKLIDEKLINRKFRTTTLDHEIAFPIIREDILAELEWFDKNEHKIKLLPLETNVTTLSPAARISQRVTKICGDFEVDLSNEMMQYLPTKWELYGDLAILPNHSFRSEKWDFILSGRPKLQKEIWQATAEALNVNRLARQAEISPDQLRSSQVTMLHGESGEVEFTDYGVKFWLDVTKVMFSSGNITERHRIGNIDMTGECVVDAFAGIGYYTLPMLVRSKAMHVYACELNPNSIEALKRGAQLNEVANQLTILEGDNQETLRNLTGLADRVHLGILPSSEQTWRLAVSCLKSTGGILHLHMNVREVEIDDFVTYCLSKLTDYATNHHNFTNIEAIHVEKVKWYAPHIRHIVIDVSIS